MSRIKFYLISLLSFILISCHQSPRGENEIYIGVISGPESELMEVAKQVAKQQHNLDIKIYEFEDYQTPNIALAEGSIDANMFQHEPFLRSTITHRNLKLITLGKMFVYPMGIYSRKHTSISELPPHAKIGIPSDPSNEARALALLAQTGVITLEKTDDLQLTTDKIKENPKRFKFLELSAAQLPRSLEDLDAACINTNYAIAAGFSPADALFKENRNTHFVNIVAIREQDINEIKYQKLMLALHSDEVRTKAKALFGEFAIVGWD